MGFTYYRIYVVAAKQMRSLKLGVKHVEGCNVGKESGLQLRIHRGGFNANVEALKAFKQPSAESQSGDDQSITTFITEPNGINKAANEITRKENRI